MCKKLINNLFLINKYLIKTNMNMNIGMNNINKNQRMLDMNNQIYLQKR